MAPSMPTPNLRPPTPYQEKPMQTSGPVGPGQGPWAKQMQTQNFVAGLQNMAGKIVQQVQERKYRQDMQIFDQFAQAYKGKNDADAQLQAADQQIAQAKAALQADPNNAQAKQTLLQATQQRKQAEQAQLVNKNKLDDISADPKKYKLLQKGYGIDDKNAGTQQRQMAIQSIKNSTGLGEKASSIIAQLPQTQQLSPQAQAQEMARKAGVISPPATGGQMLSAEVKQRADQQRHEDRQADQQFKAEALAHKVGMDTDKFLETLPAKGLVAERDADGDVARNPDGSIKTRNMTLAELKDNPRLAEQYAENQAKIDLQVAQMKATGVRAMTGVMREQRLRQQQAQASNPGQIGLWAKAVADPTSGVTLATVPAAARGAVVQAVAAGGMKIAKPLTSQEMNRMDLANNAVLNIEEAQSILARRPDMFGPAGWGKTKYEKAIAGGDPDALKFQAAITLANLPAVGIHGVRGKWAIEDLDKLDGNLYLNPESMQGVLGEIHRSASEFQSLAGRGSQLGGDEAAIPADHIVSAEDMKRALTPTPTPTP